MFLGVNKPKAHIPALLAALWLTACGGGGGGDSAPAPTTPQGGGTPAPSPAAPAPAPATGTQTLITASSQAAPNGNYGVTGTSATPVVLTLPANTAVTAGQTVRVTGISSAPWEVAQNAGQVINTRGMTITGGTALGANWTAATVPAQTPANPTQWHWVASDAAGQTLVAMDNDGPVYLSTDGGTTWTNPAGLPTNANWIGADMSADGRTMVVIAFNGNMYRSTNGGTTWAQVTSPTVALANQAYEAVTVSSDGQRIAVVIMNGPLALSNDGGATWTTVASLGTLPWRSIDSSADGRTLVAVTQADATTGRVYVSTDAGATWAVRAVGTANEGWYRARVSADGRVMAVATNASYAGGGSGLFVSRDSGQTFTAPTGAVAGSYTGLAISQDGSIIAATMSDGTTGNVQLSTNSGANFATVAVGAAGTDSNFRNVAMDQEGTRLLVATGTFTTTAGRLFTSTGNRTTFGNTGAIAGGGAGESVELRYDGNGAWRVVSSTGSFTTR